MESTILILGAGMVLLSNYSNGNLKQMGDMLGNAQSKTPTLQNQRMLLVFAGEIIFVIILASIARANPDAGGLIIAFLLVVALLWSIKHLPNLNQLASNLQGK